MAEQEQITSREVQLSFANLESILPSYTNATLVNTISHELFILDFGFFDPLTLHGLPNSDKKYPVKPITRILIDSEAAKTLLNQLSSVLNQQISKP